MSTNNTVLVEYVGRQKNRVDDVLKTRRVWAARGSALEIPAAEAGFYLMHPKEWQEITPEAYGKREAARNTAAGNVEAVKGVWKDLSIPDLHALRDEISAEIKARESAPVPKPPKAPTTDAPGSTADKDPASRDLAVARMNKIMAVVKDMDPNDPEQYAQQPKHAPRVGVVSDRVGEKVSAAEIAEALALIEQARG